MAINGACAYWFGNVKGQAGDCADSTYSLSATHKVICNNETMFVFHFTYFYATYLGS